MDKFRAEVLTAGKKPDAVYFVLICISVESFLAALACLVVENDFLSERFFNYSVLKFIGDLIEKFLRSLPCLVLSSINGSGFWAFILIISYQTVESM